MDAARTAKRLGAEEAIIVYRRTRERDAGPRDRGRGGRGGGRADALALDDQARRRGQAGPRADGARRDRLPAAHRGARGARGRLARARARSGHRPLAARGGPGTRGRRRRGRRRPEPDDRPSRGLFAGGDMVPPSARSPSRSATARRPRATSTPGCAAAPTSRRPSTSSPASSTSTPGTTPTRRGPPPALDAVRRQTTFEEVVQGSTSRTPCSRRAAACRAATASRATTATASAPTTPCSSSASPGERYAIDYDFCKGCARRASRSLRRRACLHARRAIRRGARRAVEEALGRLEADAGPARRSARPAAGLGAQRRARLDAGHDGLRP